MFCKLKTVVSFLRVIVTLLSLSKYQFKKIHPFSVLLLCWNLCFRLFLIFFPWNFFCFVLEFLSAHYITNSLECFKLSTKLLVNTGAPNESVPHIICSPEESCWLAKIQVFRLAGWEILLLIEVLPGNY